MPGKKEMQPTDVDFTCYQIRIVSVEGQKNQQVPFPKKFWKYWS